MFCHNLYQSCGLSFLKFKLAFITVIWHVNQNQFACNFLAFLFNKVIVLLTFNVLLIRSYDLSVAHLSYVLVIKPCYLVQLIDPCVAKHCTGPKQVFPQLIHLTLQQAACMEMPKSTNHWLHCALYGAFFTASIPVLGAGADGTVGG